MLTLSDVFWIITTTTTTPSLDLNEARGDWVMRWQWHQLDRMQTICTSLLTDNHTKTPSLMHSG